MLRHRLQDLLGRVVEQEHFAVLRRVPGIPFPQHLDHHVVRGLVDEGDHDFLSVDLEVPVAPLFHCRFRHFPDKIPGEDIRELVTELLHERLVDIAGLGRPHVRQRISRAPDRALGEELGDDLLFGGTVEPELAPRQAVPGIVHQRLQGYHNVAAGHVSRDMVRVGDADVGRRVGRDVGDDVVVYFAVVRVKAHVDLDMGIQGLEVGDRLLIDHRLGLVRVVLGPERDLGRSALVERFGHLELRPPLGAVAPGQKRDGQNYSSQHCHELLKMRASFCEHLKIRASFCENLKTRASFCESFFHPLVPPLETPAMIFLWKMRNRTISGIEMTTTAAIIAGIFSRPKPFSRISWIPLETRK